MKIEIEPSRAGAGRRVGESCRTAVAPPADGEGGWRDSRRRDPLATDRRPLESGIQIARLGLTATTRGPFWCVHSQAASRTEGTELEYTTNTQNYHVDESHGVSRWELQVRHEGRQGGQVSHRRRADGTAADQIPSGGAETVRGCCPGRAPGELRFRSAICELQEKKLSWPRECC